MHGIPLQLTPSGDSLLAALSDLIRHGLAHQYQQIVVHLNDEKHFYISLTGATYGRYLVKKDGTVEEELFESDIASEFMRISRSFNDLIMAASILSMYDI